MPTAHAAWKAPADGVRVGEGEGIEVFMGLCVEIWVDGVGVGVCTKLFTGGVVCEEVGKMDAGVMMDAELVLRVALVPLRASVLVLVLMLKEVKIAPPLKVEVGSLSGSVIVSVEVFVPVIVIVRGFGSDVSVGQTSVEGV